jgi:hypothetical protein
MISFFFSFFFFGCCFCDLAAFCLIQFSRFCSCHCRSLLCAAHGACICTVYMYINAVGVGVRYGSSIESLCVWWLCEQMVIWRVAAWPGVLNFS